MSNKSTANDGFFERRLGGFVCLISQQRMMDFLKDVSN